MVSRISENGHMIQIVWMMRVLILLWVATAGWIFEHQVPIDRLQRRMDAMEGLICSDHPTLPGCTEILKRVR